MRLRRTSPARHLIPVIGAIEHSLCFLFFGSGLVSIALTSVTAKIL